MKTGIAIIGCGYAADFYMANLPSHPTLEVLGVYDRNPERMSAFCFYHHLPSYTSLSDVLADTSVQIVLNLTNPDQHYPVSVAALEAGHHVYSEKPFATSMEDGYRLLELARRYQLQIASAPSSLLGDTAQTVWAALRRQEVGKVLLVFAEISEGMVHQMLHSRWVSPSGAVWPAKDEFQVGCTIEHGAYILSWLTAFFGSIVEITANAYLLIGDKDTAGRLGPDFSTAVITFGNGVVARVCFSIVAPPNHSLAIIGDRGIIEVQDIWDIDCPVTIRKGSCRDIHSPSEYLLARQICPRKSGFARLARYQDSHNMDQMLGVAEMAAAVASGCPSRLSGGRALHVLEATLAISESVGRTAVYRMETQFDPVEPMPWAQ